MSAARHSFTHEAMTTRFEVIVAGQEREYARQAAAAVFREIDRVEGLINRYDPGSDVGQLNLLGAGGSVRVSVDTLECVQTAAWVCAESGGVFDPTVGPLVSCRRQAAAESRAPTAAELAAALRRVGIDKLAIDAAHFSLGWKQVGGQLDLGGIGKGFALDKAAELLRDWEIKDTVISGGGSSVLALGTDPDRSDGWPLGIGGPWGEKAGFSRVTLSGCALSGSGSEVKGEHIVHPRTGRPAAAHIAAWAVAPTAAVSDGLATAFMMMTAEEIAVLCRKHPGTGALVVLPDERIVRIGRLGER